MSPEALPRRRSETLPDWFPPWAAQLAELYFSGTTAAFVLHGNTYDLVRMGTGEEVRYGVLAEFLAEQLFGRWSLVLHYDLGRGLRAFAGRDERRFERPRVAEGERPRLPRARRPQPGATVNDREGNREEAVGLGDRVHDRAGRSATKPRGV